MADKHINALPEAEELQDDALLAVAQQGTAMKLTGKRFRDFAEGALDKYIRGAGYLLKVGKTTTGEPGTEAEVTNSGTAQEPVLDFTIPSGQSGGVNSVNGKTGEVTVTAQNIGALSLGGWETTGRDYNELLEPGIYQIQGTSPNAPPFTPFAGFPETESHFHILVFRNWDDWMRQVAFDQRSDKVWTRRKVGGVWYPWVELINSSELVIFDNDADHAAIEAVTPEGDRAGFYFNKGGFVYAAVSNAQGERQFGYALYGEGNPQPCPKGFLKGVDEAGSAWGDQTGTFVTGWSAPGDASLQFRHNAGALNQLIDGFYYQREGNARVLDTADRAVAYRVNGVLLDGVDTAIQGVGSATVLVDATGLATVYFSVQITVAGTEPNIFTFGLDRDRLHAIDPSVPVISPISGGAIHIFTANPDAYNLNGYGASMKNDTAQFWSPERVYDTYGNAGGWPSNVFSVGDRIVGVCLGIVS